MITLGVSLKMYFGYRRTLDWCEAVAAQLRGHAAVRSGAIEVFIIPSHPALAPVLEIFDGLARIGAQNLFWEDEGAYTGEVSPQMLREMGCSIAEIGHAERRRYFAETDRQVADKTAAALRNGLTPVLCLGEERHGRVEDAVQACRQQLDASLASARRAGLAGDLIVAYEPQWAIGAAQPASAAYIGQVCQALRGTLGEDGIRVIYGGSAGPGLLSQLEGQVDGLFLGRFAHDPAAFQSILDEAAGFCPPSSAPRQEGTIWQSA
ncbi:triose-phosphate isomerase family protein [Pseudomonas sp. NPDC090202]|uniref:triose-phosphate isomerase family protein n=1 Tax=unclassified Pseudomonas TaxID=196821 RepID=UPI00380A9F31